MGIKNYISLIILMTGLALLASKCDSGNRSIKGVPVTDFYDSCQADPYDFGQIITIGDPGDKFMISLPYSWDIRENYSDTAYVMYAANYISIPIPGNERMALIVSGYNSDEDLEDYYLHELKTLRKDASLRLMETGTTDLNDKLQGYWVLFNSSSDKQTIHNLVVYLKNPVQDEIYLIQSLVYGAENYKTKLCYLKQLVRTFEIEGNN